MPDLSRQHLLYAGASLAGFFAIPFLQSLNAYTFASVYRMELAFIGSTLVAVLSTLSLWRTGVTGSRVWTGTRILVLLMMLPVAVASGALVYDAQNAWRGNDVHWHADFAVVVDGQKHDLIGSDAFCDDLICRQVNHTGTTYFHEHDDGRIHRHGPIKEREDAMLGAFFDGVGGTLTATELRYPTSDGWINRTEQGNDTLKVLVKQGIGEDRRWCAISPDVDDPCAVHDTGEPIHRPEHYIITPHTHTHLDQIFIIYDDRPIEDALSDVRRDDRYRGVSVY